MKAALKNAVAVRAQGFNAKPLVRSVSLEPLRNPQQGICDACGCWDGALVNGIGACCEERLQKRAAAPRVRHTWCFNEEQLNRALVRHYTAAAVACGLTQEQTQGRMQIVLTFLRSPEAKKLRLDEVRHAA